MQRLNRHALALKLGLDTLRKSKKINNAVPPLTAQDKTICLCRGRSKKQRPNRPGPNGGGQSLKRGQAPRPIRVNTGIVVIFRRDYPGHLKETGSRGLRILAGHHGVGAYWPIWGRQKDTHNQHGEEN